MNVFRRLIFNSSLDHAVKSGILIYYSPDFEEVPQVDIMKASLLTSHIAKAVDLLRWTDALRQKYAMVLAVLDEIEIGVCVVSPKGGVILRNRYASEIFDAKDGM